MPEVVTGSPGNLGTNSSGVGAVIFDSTEDPLRVHLGNLKAIDELAEERQKTQQHRLSLVHQMAGALNPDETGIFPADQQTLVDKGKQVNDSFQKYLASGVDPTNPTSGQAYTDFRNQQTELLGLIAASKSSNKQFTSLTQQLDQDAKGKQELDYKVGAENLAKKMAKPLQERAQITDWSDVIQQKPPELDTMLQDFVKKTYAKQDKTSSDIKTTPQGYMYQTTKAENFTPDQARAVAESITTRPMMQKALNAAWQNEPEDKRQVYLNKYAAGGMNPSLAEDKAKTDFAYDKLMLEYHQQSAGYKYLGVSPEAREAAKVRGKNNQLADKYEWLPRMIADMHNGNPDVMSNQVYQSASSPQPSTVYGTTRLNSVQLAPFKKMMTVDDGQGHMKQQEVQFPNSVLMTFVDKGRLYIATSESKAMANPKIPGSEFVSFDNPGESLTYLGNRMADKQALSGSWLAIDRKKGARTSGSGYDPKVMSGLTKEQQVAQPAKQAQKVVTKEIPASDIGKQGQKAKTAPSLTPSDKTVSGATIKGLVGTKGYEGYTEAEIRDYYGKNGYKIKD